MAATGQSDDSRQALLRHSLRGGRSHGTISIGIGIGIDFGIIALQVLL